jgi:hypothetical protein
MKRFSVYVKIKGKYTEILLAEGVQFNNENIAIHEFLTSTILILDNIDSVYSHYSIIGTIRINWLDVNIYDKKIN